jgi:hypothetical protein
MYSVDTYSRVRRAVFQQGPQDDCEDAAARVTSGGSVAKFSRLGGQARLR